MVAVALFSPVACRADRVVAGDDHQRLPGRPVGGGLKLNALGVQSMLVT